MLAIIITYPYMLDFLKRRPVSASKDACGYFIILFHKGLTNIIHLKTPSHHATPTHPTMSEKHANRAL
jgi:hypothetical protein